MKKNKTLRLASCLLIATLCSTCVISGTFAKYTSTTSGTDTTKVAKWAIDVENADITNSFTFNLFDTVYDTSVDGSNSVEDNMTATEGSIIAPGTWGYFDIDLASQSEVDATFVIEFTVNNSGVPILYSTADVTSGTAATEPDASSMRQSIDNVNGKLDKTNGKAIIRVYWMWQYESGDDANDTTLGTNASAEPSVTAKITVTQDD